MTTLEASTRTTIVDGRDELALTIDLPHETMRRLDLEVEEHELTVHANGVEETIALPACIDPWQLRVACEHDVLEIHARKPTRVLLDPESTPC